MTLARTFIGLGSNDGDPPARLGEALAALDQGETRVAAAARPVWTPFEGAEAPAVLNTVAELRTTLDPRALLARLQDLEAAAGRDRGRHPLRRLDLDLLAYEDRVVDEPDLALPHPRLARRAFVLDPWEEIAPLFLVPGTGRTVLEHARALHPDPAASPERIAAPLPDRGTDCEVLPDLAALTSWRVAQGGTVGVVMTMGALHAGHASLVHRAAAECDAVLATIFVNPTQFAPGEDLARYPRTFESDLAVLRRHGAHAVYAPTPEDVYPQGFATTIHPKGAAEGYEGAARPTHFAGVATVVTKLWQRSRAHRSYFGRKDAQQVAVLKQVRRDLDLGVAIVGCETVRAPDELALSSRNRYLDDGKRALATALARSLRQLTARVEGGTGVDEALGSPWEGIRHEYLDVVDPDTMGPVRDLRRPALAIAAARVGEVRLIDNRWVAPGEHAG